MPKSDYARRRRRPWLWLGGAVCASTAVLLVAWAMDRREATNPHPIPHSGEVQPLVPGQLTQEERSRVTTKGTREPVKLQAGGWVQVAGPDGKLKQQYQAAQTDPLPDKRMSMTQPRAVLYGSHGRVVTMRSDSMVAHVPKGALESGHLEGNVVIKVFRPKDDAPVDLAVDAAEIVIEAPEADFDSKDGLIRVDRAVRVTSAALSGTWEGLSLTLSQDGKSIQSLVADRPLGPIRIERSAEVLRKRNEGLKPQANEGAQETWNCAATTPPPAVSAQVSPRRPYLLTLYDNVHVVSTEEETVTTMDGSQMDALFMLEGDMDGGLTSSAESSTAWCGAGMEEARVEAPNDAPVDEAIVITYSGRLVMAPADAAVAPLANPEAVRIVMVGKPARVVDSKSETVITGRRISFESQVELVDLEGDAAIPARVENPDFAIAGPALALNRSTGRGGVPAGGTLRLGRLDTQQQPLTIEWSKEARFTLVPGTPKKADGTLRAAAFEGGVKVRGQDFAMDCGALTVNSEPDGERDVPRKIVADQGVLASNLTDSGGTLQAQRVEVLLRPDAEGNARPQSLLASGGVVVSDPSQTMWASTMRALFVESRKGAGLRDARAAKPGRDAKAAALSVGAKAELGSVVAEGPVELLLKDGTRVWATRMEGDAAARTAYLSGPDVLVVRGNSVIDQLSEVRVQESPGKLSGAGTGRVSYYTERVIPATRERMARPHLPQVPQMQATWREGMAYAEGVIPGKLGAPDRSLLLLQGAVKVRAARSPLEEESLDSDEVALEMVPQSNAKRAPTSAAEGAPDMGQVARMVAKGNVDIRAKSWPTAEKKGEPKFFRLQSQNATYDVVQGLCSVDGAGNILVNDPSPEIAAKPAGKAAPLPFSPEGVTKFTWQRSLGMRKVDEFVTNIALDGNVEMQHVGAESSGNGTLMADHLEAAVRNAQKTAAAPSDAPVLGAGATLEHVMARGKVLVRTSEYDMEAGEFALNERTQVATMGATPGRVVTILKRDMGSPQRAQSAVWDMKTGLITIEKLRSSVSR